MTAAQQTSPELLTNAAWTRLPWLVHGFSTRVGGLSKVYQPASADGDLNLGFTAEDDREVVLANRRILLGHLAAGRDDAGAGLVIVRQIHSDRVHRVGKPDVLPLDNRPALEGDGLMTNEQGVLLGILTADCVPVLVVDTRRRAVAAFHAGWRGTLQQIVERGVQQMCEEFGSLPEDLEAAVGPAIGSCCYGVGEPVRDAFMSRFPYGGALFAPGSAGDEARLDLAEANRRQLLGAGIDPLAISMSEACTACRVERFFSHRAQHGRTGRMMSLIGLVDR